MSSGKSKGVETRLGPELPGEPFRQWLRQRLRELRADERVAGAMNRLAEELGVRHRNLRRYVKGEEGVGYRRFRLEAMLDRVGVPITDLYPDLVIEDPPLEPDASCPKCEEMVIPIKGCCPWCDTPLRQAA